MHTHINSTQMHAYTQQAHMTAQHTHHECAKSVFTQADILEHVHIHPATHKLGILASSHLTQSCIHVHICTCRCTCIFYAHTLQNPGLPHAFHKEVVMQIIFLSFLDHRLCLVPAASLSSGRTTGSSHVPGLPNSSHL